VKTLTLNGPYSVILVYACTPTALPGALVRAWVEVIPDTDGVCDLVPVEGRLDETAEVPAGRWTLPTTLCA
jgi:hypothetical protein